MNNKEMAMNLTNFDPKMYELHKDAIGQEDIENKEKYEIAVEMGKWKDLQLKDYLLNKMNNMMSAFHITHDGDFLTKCTVYDTILNELFN